MVARVAIPQCPAGVGWAGSIVSGDWRLWGVSLALDARLKQAGWRSGVGIRKHVEPLGVRMQGGGCPPCQPILPLEVLSPRSDRFGEVFQATRGAARSSGWRPSLLAPRGSQAVCELRGGAGQSDPIFHPCI